ncbi:MAG: YihY/virulence factor BrkB family protein [Clostridiales bacterium]|jgi:membrane protein|nr:YihY/virulence factor BrkB family protein [Clostridiales bacterium]
MKENKKQAAKKLGSKIQKNRFFGTILQIATRCFNHNIFGMAAELAYYLLFSFMPLIIFGSSLIGLLNFDISQFASFTKMIPEDVMALVRTYYQYIKEIKSPTLMYSGLVLSIYFASSAMRSLMRSLDTAYDVKKGRHPVKQFIISFFFAVIFLVIILFSMLLMLAGGYIIQLIVDLFPEFANFQAPIQLLRFVVMIFPIWGSLFLLYLFAPNRKLTVRSALPGALFSTVIWMAVSMFFSFYVTNMGNYSFLYGSLGAIIVLMLWLYITGMIFILGGELSFVLMIRREEKKKRQIQALLEQAKQQEHFKENDPPV